MDRNRDFSSNFSLTFQITGRFMIVFTKLILEKGRLAELLGHDGKLASDMSFV